MTLVALAGVALLLSAIPTVVQRLFARSASPTLLTGLILLTLAGLLLVPVGAAACLGGHAADRSRSPLQAALLLAGSIALVAISGWRTLREMRRRRDIHGALADALTYLPIHDRTGARLLDADGPRAFLVGDEVVITTGMVQCLDEQELGAVVAHERAHRDGRHNQLAAWAASLRHGSLGLPGGRRAETLLREQIELSADREAASTPGARTTLISAIDKVVAANMTMPFDDDPDLVSRRRSQLHTPPLAAGAASSDKTIVVLLVVVSLVLFVTVCAAVHVRFLWFGIVLCVAAGINVFRLARHATNRD